MMRDCDLFWARAEIPSDGNRLTIYNDGTCAETIILDGQAIALRYLDAIPEKFPTGWDGQF